MELGTPQKQVYVNKKRNEMKQHQQLSLQHYMVQLYSTFTLYHAQSLLTVL